MNYYILLSRNPESDKPSQIYVKDENGLVDPGDYIEDIKGIIFSLFHGNLIVVDEESELFKEASKNGFGEWMQFIVRDGEVKLYT